MQDWAYLYAAIGDDISSAAMNSLFTTAFGGFIALMAVIAGFVNTRARRKEGKSRWPAILPMVALFAVGAGYGTYGFQLIAAAPLAIHGAFRGCEQGGHGVMYMRVEAADAIRFHSDGSTIPDPTTGHLTLRTTRALCDTLALNATETFLCTDGGECVGWVADGEVERGQVRPAEEGAP